MRADSGFYTHAVVAACRKLDVSFSITIRQHASLRNLIEAIPEDAWTPIPLMRHVHAGRLQCQTLPKQPATVISERLAVRSIHGAPPQKWQSSAQTLPRHRRHLRESRRRRREPA